MTIEIQRRELEAMIQHRMDTGRFESVEAILLDALRATSGPEERAKVGGTKQNLTQFLRESPLWGSELVFERNEDLARSPGL